MNCASCAYCYHGPDPERRGYVEQVQCRRWPAASARNVWRGKPESKTIWPAVDLNDWCGEYRPQSFPQPDTAAPPLQPAPPALEEPPKPRGWRSWLKW